MSTKVTKAVIAAAGRGTRFLPTVKAYAKELVPIINKPNIQYLVEEAIAAGITDLCIVHREGETTIKSYFTPDSDLEKYLESVNKTEYLDSLKSIWTKLKTLEFIPQDTNLPYGNASPLLSAKSFIGNDPFVYMFGDDLTVEKDCGRYLRKMISTFDQYSPSVIASVKDVGPIEIIRYGSAKYLEDPKYPNRISGMYEKLPADQAPSFFAQGGRFVVDSAKLWPVLTTQSTGKNNELWFADAVNTLAANDVVLTEATDLESDWMTTGDPLRWLKANIAVTLNDEAIAPDLKDFLNNLK
ncbi:MAG: UTP-glucose-1-phosphate uridylyltransferase [Candidatus Shapirobacteria bacterium GW2011_GWF1_38_23]|nr:MAG: UTP-glucose-1-phosphate uridylyltransferase [Candidatus Shapirobacteria bacterium GW2011_GWF2_37_20]KKQ64877.1 MAG: UTP-glucose-1-phosphate uridylyltransferase [Candidatus Shapirobacteria bacterium GW2011_GWF1_38_23]